MGGGDGASEASGNGVRVPQSGAPTDRGRAPRPGGVRGDAAPAADARLVCGRLAPRAAECRGGGGGEGTDCHAMTRRAEDAVAGRSHHRRLLQEDEASADALLSGAGAAAPAGGMTARGGASSPALLGVSPDMRSSLLRSRGLVAELDAERGLLHSLVARAASPRARLERIAGGMPSRGGEALRAALEDAVDGDPGGRGGGEEVDGGGGGSAATTPRGGAYGAPLRAGIGALSSAHALSTAEAELHSRAALAESGRARAEAALAEVKEELRLLGERLGSEAAAHQRELAEAVRARDEAISRASDTDGEGARRSQAERDAAFRRAAELEKALAESAAEAARVRRRLARFEGAEERHESATAALAARSDGQQARDTEAPATVGPPGSPMGSSPIELGAFGSVVDVAAAEAAADEHARAPDGSGTDADVDIDGGPLRVDGEMVLTRTMASLRSRCAALGRALAATRRKADAEREAAAARATELQAQLAAATEGAKARSLEVSAARREAEWARARYERLLRDIAAAARGPAGEPSRHLSAEAARLRALYEDAMGEAEARGGGRAEGKSADAFVKNAFVLMMAGERAGIDAGSRVRRLEAAGGATELTAQS